MIDFRLKIKLPDKPNSKIYQEQPADVQKKS